MHRCFVFVCLSWAAVSAAQVPFANLFWEANDGSGWTRNALTTTQSSVQVRLVAEWGAPNGVGFGGVRFDGLINAALEGDTASGMTRPGNFAFTFQNIAATHIPGAIKIDDARDMSPPGLGAFWVQPNQAPPDIGGGMGFDHSSAPVIFAFNLTFQQTTGTRIVSQIPGQFQGGETAIIWLNPGETRLVATWTDVAITYIPSPSAAAAATLIAGTAACRRRRRVCT